MSICISTHCKKYSTCKLAHPNFLYDDKLHQAINWHDSGSYSTGFPTHLENGDVIYNPIRHYDCGEQGNYAMYEPIEQKVSLIKWNDCNTTCPSTISENNRAIVLYSIASSTENVGYKLYDWIEARWNGFEWRTDDFGLTDKENLFDNPKYKPVAWFEVKIPDEFNNYKN